MLRPSSFSSAGKFDRQVAGQPVHAPHPVAQFFFGIGVVEAQHGPRVAHFLEALGRLAAHALRRRVGRHQFGMLAFEPLQLIHQLVEGLVGDGRRIHHVVQVLVVADLLAQFLDALRGIRFGFCCVRPWAGL